MPGQCLFAQECRLTGTQKLSLNRPIELQEVEAIRILSQHRKVVESSALSTGRLHPQGKIPGTHFCQRLTRPQERTAAGRFKSMKNRTGDLPDCSAVPPHCCTLRVFNDTTSTAKLLLSNVMGRP